MSIRPATIRALASLRGAEPTPGTAEHIRWMAQVEALGLTDDERDLLNVLEADNGRLDARKLDLLFAAARDA